MGGWDEGALVHLTQKKKKSVVTVVKKYTEIYCLHLPFQAVLNGHKITLLYTHKKKQTN